MSLNELATEIHDISKAKGFWPANNEELCFKTERNPAEVLMLIVTEAAEAMEAIRDGMPLSKPHTRWRPGPNAPDNITIHKTPTGHASFELPGSPQRVALMTPEDWRSIGFIGKPEGVPSEMADIIIRVLDACAAWGIDIDAAVREKIVYNAQREHLHGRKS